MAQKEQKSFKELFEESLKGKHFSEGDVVEGTVVQITKDFVLIDIGYKSEGQIPIQEFQDETGKIQLKEGDKFPVYLERIENDEGHIQLSRERAQALQAWDHVIKAADEGLPIEGYIYEKVKGGFSVDIGVKAFLPASQVDVRPPKNLNQFVGKKYKFKIVKLNKKRNNVVLSRRSVLEQERQEKKTSLLGNIEEGKIVDGTVKNITEYGVFIDLGGADGLLHITDMSWGRLKHPSEMVSVGDTLQVKILSYDPEKERISLGLKQIQPDPWNQVKYKYREADRVKGKVVSLVDYGAFVEIEKGVEGLIHVSEMSWTQKIKHPSQVLNVGNEVEAQVLEIDSVNRRIALGLKQTLENPWDALAKKYPSGTKIKGTVKNVTDFGIFVGVDEGIDGLVHVSDISWTQKNIKPQELYKKGDEIEVVVLNIDPENEKFSLGIKQLDKNPWTEVESTLKKGSVVEGKVTKIVDFGLFVEVAPYVEGLVHISEIAKGKPEEVKALYNVGDTVRAEVLSIDHRERKISLSIKSLNFKEEKESIAKYVDEGKKQSKKKFGDLFDKEGIIQKLKNVVGKKSNTDEKDEE